MKVPGADLTSISAYDRRRKAQTSAEGETMKRTAGAFMLLAALGGCVATESGPGMSGPAFSCGGGNGMTRPAVPGVQGPLGQPIAMAAPYSACPPGETAAREMMARSL